MTFYLKFFKLQVRSWNDFVDSKFPDLSQIKKGVNCSFEIFSETLYLYQTHTNSE